jgi:hypothetical protein
MDEGESVAYTQSAVPANGICTLPHYSTNFFFSILGDGARGGASWSCITSALVSRRAIAHHTQRVGSALAQACSDVRYGLDIQI